MIQNEKLFFGTEQIIVELKVSNVAVPYRNCRCYMVCVLVFTNLRKSSFSSNHIKGGEAVHWRKDRCHLNFGSHGKLAIYQHVKQFNSLANVFVKSVHASFLNALNFVYQKTLNSTLSGRISPYQVYSTLSDRIPPYQVESYRTLTVFN